MTDISKCANETCPLKETCYRYTAHRNPYWQSYVHAKWKEEDGTVTCNLYWNNSKLISKSILIKQIISKMSEEKTAIFGGGLSDLEAAPVLDAAMDMVDTVWSETKTTRRTSTKDPKAETIKKAAKEESITFENYTTLGGYFQVSDGLYSVMKRNVLNQVNTLLLGPSGVGKTELVSNIAKELNLPLTIFDMGTMSDPIMSLVGTHVIKVVDGVTTSSFVKSRFSEVIQRPGIVLLDELNRASVTANNLLFPCLDFRRELPMEYCFDDSAPVAIHPECVFIATANLGSQYTGTHKLDSALTNRFMMIEVDALDKKQVTTVLVNNYPGLNEDKIGKIVDVYTAINKAHEEFTIEFSMSLRHLKTISEMVLDGFTIYDSFYITCKGIGGAAGLKSLEEILVTVKI